MRPCVSGFAKGVCSNVLMCLLMSLALPALVLAQVASAPADARLKKPQTLEQVVTRGDQGNPFPIEYRVIESSAQEVRIINAGSRREEFGNLFTTDQMRAQDVLLDGRCGAQIENELQKVLLTTEAQEKLKEIAAHLPANGHFRVVVDYYTQQRPGYFRDYPEKSLRENYFRRLEDPAGIVTFDPELGLKFGEYYRIHFQFTADSLVLDSLDLTEPTEVGVQAIPTLMTISSLMTGTALGPINYRSELAGQGVQMIAFDAPCSFNLERSVAASLDGVKATIERRVRELNAEIEQRARAAQEEYTRSLLTPAAIQRMVDWRTSKERRSMTSPIQADGSTKDGSAILRLMEGIAKDLGKSPTASPSPRP